MEHLSLSCLRGSNRIQQQQLRPLRPLHLRLPFPCPFRILLHCCCMHCCCVPTLTSDALNHHLPRADCPASSPLDSDSPHTHYRLCQRGFHHHSRRHSCCCIWFGRNSRLYQIERLLRPVPPRQSQRRYRQMARLKYRSRCCCRQGCCERWWTTQ